MVKCNTIIWDLFYTTATKLYFNFFSLHRKMSNFSSWEIACNFCASSHTHILSAKTQFSELIDKLKCVYNLYRHVKCVCKWHEILSYIRPIAK